MNLIIISGPEATGKTAIGREIAKILGYKFQTKDTIKEAMFDAKPRSTWRYSWYEKRAKDEFFKEIKRLVDQDQSAVIESNFVMLDKQRLKVCLNDKVILTEIYCTVRGLTSFKRFVSRNENGTRHKGHHDRRWYLAVLIHDILRALNIQWPYKPLGLTNKLLIVDTTDFSKVNYAKIAAFAKQTPVA